MPSAMVAAAGIVTGLPSDTAAFIEGRREVCTPTILNFGICFLDGAGNAADQAAAADGNDYRFNFGMLLKHFKTESSLPCDHRVIIKGMDEGQMLLMAAADGLFTGLVVIRAVQDDVGAVGFGGRHLDQRSGQRHANLCADAALAGVISQSLSVVPCRSGNHALIALFLGQESAACSARRAL